MVILLRTFYNILLIVVTQLTLHTVRPYKLSVDCTHFNVEKLRL